MSGGTDSSVAAILLQQQGYVVVGLTLRTWSENDSTPDSPIPTYINQAISLAQNLGIEHHIADIRTEFYNTIINYFKNEYLIGRTPHPCALCNPQIKWKWLLNYANRLSCHFIATGHYTNITNINNKFYITHGADPDKEQSFFLWGLNQEILSRTLFPLGQLTKTEVKTIAAENGYKAIAKQKESIGICFITQHDYRPFLKQLITNDGITIDKGTFVDKNGNFIGHHNGFPYYTVGQRRGLGLVPQTPLYVTHIKHNNNTITLGSLSDLYKTTFTASGYNIISKDDFTQPVDVRVRYRKQNAKGYVVFNNDDRLTVNLIEPEWGIAPGQAVAFYNNNRLLGGGFIE